MPKHSTLTGADLHPPGAHKTQHEDGGSDEISLTGLTGSPALSSATTAVTQAPADNSTKVATTAYADAAAAAATGTYTDEKAQDAVGGILDDGTVGQIVFTYDDATPKISGAIENDVALGGNPTTTTQTAGNNTTRIATTAFVTAAVADVLDGATFTGDINVPDEAYDATSWNGSTEVPTKNAVRDKIEDILDGVTFTGDVVVPDEAYDATNWNGSLEVPTKNAVRDKIESMGGGGGGGGGLVLLGRYTASGGSAITCATRNATGQSGDLFQSDYDKYLIIGESIATSGNGVDVQLEVGTGGGGSPTWVDGTGNPYENAWRGFKSNGNEYTQAGASGLQAIFNSISNNSGYGNGTFQLTAVHTQSTSIRKQFYGTKQFVDSGPANIFAVGGLTWTTTGTACTAVRFLPSSGTISGNVTVYGYANS